MLLFNGLYFRGDWAQKFDLVNELKAFDSVKGKQDTKFITTNGLFKYVEIPSKNLIAVEIPYKVHHQVSKYQIVKQINKFFI